MMGTWCHRVVRDKDKYRVCEVFYDDKGGIYDIIPADLSGESIESLREYCQWALGCLDKGILDGEITDIK